MSKKSDESWNLVTVPLKSRVNRREYVIFIKIANIIILNCAEKSGLLLDFNVEPDLN